MPTYPPSVSSNPQSRLHIGEIGCDKERNGRDKYILTFAFVPFGASGITGCLLLVGLPHTRQRMPKSTKTSMVVASERRQTVQTRTPQACYNCRRRKSKCDNSRPCCRNCGRRKEECKWPGYPLPGGYSILESSTPSSEGQHDLNKTPSFVDTASAVSAPSVSDIVPPALLRHLLQTFYDRHHDVEFCSFIHKPSFDIEQCSSPFFMAALISLSSLYHSDEESKSKFGVDIVTLSQSYFLPQARALSRDQSQNPSVYNIQANLVLALCELLMWNENGAWMCTGLAIRMAQALRLGKEYNQRHAPKEKEIRRRTFWATYTMDQLVALSCARIPTIKKFNIAIQLPCPEAAFAYEEDFEGPNIEQILSDTDLTPQSGVLPFYIATMPVWAGMMACYANDGRARTKLPPSDPASRFYCAELAMEKWIANLPAKMQWSESNFRLHKSLGQGKIFVSMHMLLRHGLCYAHQEYLPQLDEPASLLDCFDGAGLSYHHHDPRLIETCLRNATEILDISHFLYHGSDSDRETLQSLASANAMLTAGAVKLWFQHIGSLQDGTGKATFFAKAQAQLILEILQSWKHWKVVTTWIETLEMLARLYHAAYSGQPGISLMLEEAEPSTRDIETYESPATGSLDGGNKLEISNGNGIPDPFKVRQRLHNKIRAIMLLNFISSTEKEEAMRIYLGTLWQHMSLPDMLEQFGSLPEMS